MDIFKFGKAVLVFGLTSIITVSPLTANQSFAQSKQDPSADGVPGTRVGAGTRGGDCAVEDKLLTALIPETYLGKTVSERPTFYFYVPQSAQGKVIEFILRDEEDQLVYEQMITINEHSGIIGIDLADAPNPVSLGKNQRYHWYFSILCDVENRSRDLVVDGWVERVDASLESNQEQFFTLSDQTELWYDALKTLVELRRTNPQNLTIEQRWTELLHSVGLETLAQEPLLNTQIQFQAMTSE